MKKLIILSFLCIPLLAEAQAFKTIERTIYFDPGKASLTEVSVNVLNELYASIKLLEIQKIELFGNTDYRMPNSFNNRLGIRRAESVKKFLIDSGIEASFISVISNGETSPVVNTKKEKELWRNRRVDIIVTYYHKLPLVSRPGQEIPGYNESNWEIYRGEKGSLVFIKSTSFDTPLSNLSFNIQEALDPCDMIRQNLSTMSTTGECLQSAGMLFLDIRDKNGQPVKPKAGETVQIWFPATSYDPTMEIYLPVDGVWKSTSLKPEFRTREGKTYYMIETTFSAGWNLDRPICPCPANGPMLKVKTFGSSKVYVSYQTNNVTKLPSIDKNLYRISKKIDNEDSTYVTVYFMHKGKVHMVHKPLSQLGKRKNGQVYVVRKKDFIRKNPTDPKEPEKDLCGLLKG